MKQLIKISSLLLIVLLSLVFVGLSSCNQATKNYAPSKSAKESVTEI